MNQGPCNEGSDRRKKGKGDEYRFTDPAPHSFSGFGTVLHGVRIHVFSANATRQKKQVSAIER